MAGTRWALAALCLGFSACAERAPVVPVGGQPPREIRLGSTEMAIQSVERGVNRAEVEEAVQGMVANARMCMPWPSLWVEGSDRRNVFLIRYDLMARDWGEEIAADSERRMQEFVDLGFLTARVRPEIGPRVMVYVLTEAGGEYLNGSPYGGARPSFCAPSQRRLSQITGLQWGEFACGSLRVEFTHVAQDWPSWATTQAARARVSQTWAEVGQAMPGSVTLSRQWFRLGRLPRGRDRNGELHSLCYDQARQLVTGDDLDLHSRPPAELESPAGRLDAGAPIEFGAAGQEVAETGPEN